MHEPAATLWPVDEEGRESSKDLFDAPDRTNQLVAQASREHYGRGVNTPLDAGDRRFVSVWDHFDRAGPT